MCYINYLDFSRFVALRGLSPAVERPATSPFGYNFMFICNYFCLHCKYFVRRFDGAACAVVSVGAGVRKQANVAVQVLPNREPELALAALKKGDAVAALALADRWLRIGGETAASLLARSEAARQMGFDDFAQADLAAALERDPLNPVCSLKALETDLPGYGALAARNLLGRTRDETFAALAKLSGQESLGGAGWLQAPAQGIIQGWATWRPGKSAKLVLYGDRTEELPLTPDPSDARAEFFGCAAEFHVDVADPACDCVQLIADGGILASLRLLSRGPELEPPTACSPRTATIIVPVYGDLDATRACLESAAEAVRRAHDSYLLIIDDASPDPALSAFLRDFAQRPNTRLLINRRNRGYVGTVNRALSLAPTGDVLLLNADTLVAPDILARFRRIAGLDARIGAINPLSNHGEFVSFPKPFAENVFDRRAWLRVHEAAGEVNRDVAIDLPASVGFCLYLTRACLDAVGLLSNEYENGYLEDADYALRLREAGFRNVCAPSIFTPHLGSRSFRGDKKRLVAHNLRVLKRRFPGHQSECDAFMLRDPLARFRARIERALLADIRASRLVVGPARLDAAMTRRATVLERQGVATIIAVCAHDGEGWRLRLRRGENGSPRNFVISLDDEAEVDAALSHLSPDRIEIAGEQDAPPELVRALSSQGAPLWRLIAEAPHRSNALAISGEVAVDAMSRACCGTTTPRRDCLRGAEGLATTAVGVVLPEETSATLAFLLQLAPLAASIGRQFIVLGETTIDRRLMGRGLFVTGQIESDEIGRVVDQYGLGAYLLPYRSSHYWALASWRAERPLPAIYFNWSGVDFREFPDDLSLHPSLDNALVLARLERWLAGGAEERK